MQRSLSLRSLALRRAAPAITGCALFTISASAQTLLYARHGDKANDRLGACVRSAGDVNGDTLPDWVAGAPENGNILSSGQGFVRVYNGSTGATLFTFDGEVNDDQFGISVDGAGDVNNDGRADIVMGAPLAGSNLGRAYVRSGLTGGLLYTLTGPVAGDRMGSSVAGAGDVNNDGFDDVIVGGYESNGGGTARGKVIVYSGQSGSVIRTHTGAANSHRIGVSVDGIGDVNADGSDDYIIGSYFGGASIHSGASGAVLQTFLGVTDDRLGFAVAGAGDVDGDSKPDVIVGAPQDNNIFGPGKGFARIYSGFNGALIRTLMGSTDGDRFGISVSGAFDMNGDGRAEVVVGADQQPITGNGYARLFDGATGALIHNVGGTTASHLFGASVAGLGNVNGAGGMEFAVGVPESSTSFSRAGRVEVWTANVSSCPTPYTYCASADNSTGFPALMSSSGSTSIAANNFVLVASQLPPGTLGLFYYGATEIQTVFGNGFRCVGGTVFRLPIRSANGSGVATFNVNYSTLPLAGPIVSGSVVKFQYWYRNPAAGGANFNLTNGLSATFCD